MAPKRQSTGTKQAPARPNTFKPGDELVFEDEEGISPKTHSEQTASPAKLKSVQAPSSVTNSSIPKSSSDKKKKKRSGSWLTTALLVYFIYANLFLCSDPSYATASNVCNGISFIDRTREAVIHRIDDLAQPYLEQAQTYAQPYLEPVQPYYDTLREHTDPLIAQGQQVYATHVQPRAMVYYQQARAQAGPLKLRLFMHYDTHAKPIVQRYAKFYGSLWRLNVAPALDRWTVEAHIKAKEGLVYLQHHVDAFQAEHFPVLHAWTTHTLWPFLKARAVTARYIVLHYIVPATKRTYAFTYDTVNGNIVPHLNRWYSLYATPQIARVKQKIWEHRTEQLAHAVVASELERQESVDHALHVLDNEPEQLTAQVIEEKAAPTSEETTPIIFESVRASVVEEPAIIPTETPLPEVEIEPSSSTIVEDTQQTIIAAVPPTSETPVIQDESSAAEKEAARIAAKRAKVEAIHTQYEQDLSELVNAERALLTERLNARHQSAVSDVQARFQSRIRDLRMEIERIDSRLTKWADKRRNGAASTANDDVDTVVSKAQQKAAQKAIDLVEDLDNYRSEYTEAGQQMVKTAVAPIASLVKRFHDDVGQKYIWLENVRVKDWTRYHEMEKREKSTREEFSQLTDTSGIEQELNGLEETVDTIVEAFAEKSEQLRSSLKGEQLVFSKVADPLSSAAESASATVASMFGSTDESTPASLAESADSLISTAEDALVSVADEMQLTAAAEAVGEQVETASETLDSLLTEAATTASTASYHVVPEEDEPSTGSPPEAPSPSPEEDAEDIEDGFETSASAAFEAPSASEGEPTQAVEDSPSHDAGDFIFAAQTPGSRDATDDATSPQEAVVEDIPTSSQTQIPEHQEL